jgi:hypothetical protein
LDGVRRGRPPGVIVFSALLTFIYIHETRELAERFSEEYLEQVKRPLQVFF